MRPNEPSGCVICYPACTCIFCNTTSLLSTFCSSHARTLTSFAVLIAQFSLQVTAALVALLCAREWFARLDTEAVSRTSEQLLENPSSMEKVGGPVTLACRAPVLLPCLVPSVAVEKTNVLGLSSWFPPLPVCKTFKPRSQVCLALKASCLRPCLPASQSGEGVKSAQ